ncbi:MAG: hypothetical protein SGJ10_13015 [Bacteroidota bacterium]|nr:hypothetical protein [Bacteroidota bacterium]
MKYIFLLNLSLICGITLSLSSCHRSGCMDSSASNYSSTVKKDNGTCTYDGSVTFWFAKAASDNLIANGSKTLSIYVDGTLAGTCQANNYTNTIPACNQSGMITARKYCGGMRGTRNYTYKIIDDNNILCWQGNIDFQSKICKPFELTK